MTSLIMREVIVNHHAGSLEGLANGAMTKVTLVMTTIAPVAAIMLVTLMMVIAYDVVMAYDSLPVVGMDENLIYYWSLVIKRMELVVEIEMVQLPSLVDLVVYLLMMILKHPMLPMMYVVMIVDQVTMDVVLIYEDGSMTMGLVIQVPML